jgi:hypothetical protein
MAPGSINPEWKKGSAELLLLSLIEAVPAMVTRLGSSLSRGREAHSAFMLHRYIPCFIALKKRVGCKASGWKRAGDAVGALLSTDAARPQGSIARQLIPAKPHQQIII